LQITSREEEAEERNRGSKIKMTNEAKRDKRNRERDNGREYVEKKNEKKIKGKKIRQKE